jgi:hypothetical protein
MSRHRDSLARRRGLAVGGPLYSRQEARLSWCRRVRQLDDATSHVDYRRDRDGSDDFVDLVAVYDYLHEQ